MDDDPDDDGTRDAEGRCLYCGQLPPGERPPLADSDRDEDPWWCRRCRAEKSFPHPWCATIGCDCEECVRPDLAQLAFEMQRRWPS